MLDAQNDTSSNLFYLLSRNRLLNIYILTKKKKREKERKNTKLSQQNLASSVDVVNLAVDAFREKNDAGQFTTVQQRERRGKSGGVRWNIEEETSFLLEVGSSASQVGSNL